jgi:hypothetical protein
MSFKSLTHLLPKVVADIKASCAARAPRLGG